VIARASAELLLLSKTEVEELSALMAQVDSVELKLMVPHGERRSTLDALDSDLLEAELRHVYFFDTPELALYQGGVIVRGRDRPGDSVVKLRPIDPATLESSLRAAKRFRVEVDATPRGYVCSASYRRSLAPEDLRAWWRGDDRSRISSHPSNARSCTSIRRRSSLTTISGSSALFT
jgi:hypothetical protein